MKNKGICGCCGMDINKSQCTRGRKYMGKWIEVKKQGTGAGGTKGTLWYCDLCWARKQK